MGSLTSKTAVVTGGAQGIGRAIARRLAADGAHVIVTDIQDASDAVSEIKQAGGSAEYRSGDVTDEQSMEDTFDETSVDILVNNAAYYEPLVTDKKRFDRISDDEWDAVMAVNVKGVFIASKAALPRFNPGGRIINMASGVAIKGVPGFLHYVASKAAVLGMTRAMATELADDDIRVNAIMPGFTVSGSSKLVGDEKIERRAQDQLIQQPITPDDIAATVAFLAGPDSEMMTGQALNIDGGLSFY